MDYLTQLQDRGAVISFINALITNYPVDASYLEPSTLPLNEILNSHHKFLNNLEIYFTLHVLRHKLNDTNVSIEHIVDDIYFYASHTFVKHEILHNIMIQLLKGYLFKYLNDEQVKYIKSLNN